MIKTTGNQKTIEYGKGTVKSKLALVNGKGVIALSTHERREIGSHEVSPIEENDIKHVLSREVVITFDNTKGLELLIVDLQRIRAMMFGDKTEASEYGLDDLTELYEPNSKIDGKKVNKNDKRQ